MDQPAQNHPDDLATLAEDARALLAATAEMSGEAVGEARKRLAAALDKGKAVYGQAKEKALAGAKATDESVRAHPYLAIGLALGAGALIGYLAARRHHCGHG